MHATTLRRFPLLLLASLAPLAGAAAQEADGPTPGSITVRLNGRFSFFAGFLGQSDLNDSYYYDQASSVASEAPFYIAGGTVLSPAQYAALPESVRALARPAVLLREKLGSFGDVDIARLYPGVDGITAAGLRYGASLEIRSTDSGGAGGGQLGSVLAANRVRTGLDLRRAWGYLGLDDYGTIRYGQQDGPETLLMEGSFENFNSGGWNGVIPTALASRFNTIWPFPDVGSAYVTNKIVYLSPELYHVDIGIGFEPDSAGLNGDGVANGCVLGSVAGPGCDQLVSTSSADVARRRDTVDVAVRLREVIGPVGVAAYVDFKTGGRVADSGYAPGTLTLGAGGIGTARQRFHGHAVGTAGIQATYAGLAFGGMILGGAVNNLNGTEALQPSGTQPETAFLVGGSYTLGPAVVGSHYFNSWLAGNQTGQNRTTVGGYNAQGVAAGGTLNLAPGLAVFVESLWGEVKQNGYDLDLDQPGDQHNRAQVSYYGLGTSVAW